MGTWLFWASVIAVGGIAARQADYWLRAWLDRVG